MGNENVCMPPSEEDLRAALKEMRSYIDVTEDDLKKIYLMALKHAQERIASRIPVKEIMAARVVTVKKTADLQEAARILSESRISGMPVVDDANRVVGVISEADILMAMGMKRDHTFKDLLRNLLGERVPARSSEGTTVESVMSFPPVTSLADDQVDEVARILDERRIKRLPVVDAEGHLIGIISRADIVRAISRRSK